MKRMNSRAPLPHGSRVKKYSQLGSVNDRTVTIADCVEATQVLLTSNASQPVVVFSPDGSLFATVVYRGDLSRNRNVYSLLVFQASQGERATPPPVLEIDFEDDPRD